ncbi:MAG: Ig-like domain-containing protein [Deltaproteobacteria bacterium]|nr:Ig-like domain-containing protein [Deltaproteobacteria bacterium]
MKKAFISLISLLIICLSTQSYAALNLTDRTALTGYLQTLSTGWDNSASANASVILTKNIYNSNDWNDFFTTYFVSNKLNDNLIAYIGYPIFSWYSPAVHTKLQEGIAPSCFNILISNMTKSPEILSANLVSDDQLRQHLMNSARLLAFIQGGTDVGNATRALIYNNLVYIVNLFSGYMLASAMIDTGRVKYVPLLKGQIMVGIGDSYPLDNVQKFTLANLLDLTGKRADIWNNYGVLIIDNARLSDTQLSIIDQLLSTIDPAINPTKFITVRDFLATTEASTAGIFARTASAINIFGVQPGVALENGFPSDVEPKINEIFSSCLAHEITHLIDNKSQGNTPYAEKKAKLIQRAGSVDLQYLRSNVGANYFNNNPQEFMASNANIYFVSTNHTLDEAVIRWNNNFREPINQFLFFAETMSNGKNSLIFYSYDTNGVLSWAAYNLLRGSNGLISKITTPFRQYLFTYDQEGFVIAVSIVRISRLISYTSPANSESNYPLNQPILIYGNAPLQVDTVQGNVIISPNIQFITSLEQGGTVLRITQLSEFQKNTRFTVTLKGRIFTNIGQSIRGEEDGDYVFSFSTGNANGAGSGNSLGSGNGGGGGCFISEVINF